MIVSGDGFVRGCVVSVRVCVVSLHLESMCRSVRVNRTCQSVSVTFPSIYLPTSSGGSVASTSGWLRRLFKYFETLTLSLTIGIIVLCTAGRLATGSPLLGWTQSSQ